MIPFKAADKTTLERRARAEAGIYAIAPDLTPVDAVRIARCLLENVYDNEEWLDFHVDDTKVRDRVDDACHALDRLRLDYP
jgi:hypothetical protein